MVNETDEKIHGESRRLVARAYAMDTMVNLEPMIDELIIDLLRKLRELQGQRIDLGHWVQLYAFGTFPVFFSFFSSRLCPYVYKGASSLTKKSRRPIISGGSTADEAESTRRLIYLLNILY